MLLLGCAGVSRSFDPIACDGDPATLATRERNAVLENGVASRRGLCLIVRGAPVTRVARGIFDALSRGSDTRTVRWAAPGEEPTRAG